MKKGFYAVYLILFFTVVISTLKFTNAPAIFYADLPSLILVLLFYLLITIFPWGFKKTGSFYKAVFQKEITQERKEEATAYFRSITVYTLTASLLCFFIGMVAMLGNLSDMTQIGPALAMSMLSVMYGVILCMTIFLPFRMSLERRN